MEERKAYRTNRLQEYFKHSTTHELPIDQVQVEGQVLDPNGEALPLDWALRINGLLMGLNNANDKTLALGLIRNYLEEKNIVRVSTPLREIESVKAIQLSSFRHILLNEEGES
jgi:polynucleotide 5'-kinase involved in rRNA processing